jgi:hypothetical protein
VPFCSRSLLEKKGKSTHEKHANLGYPARFQNLNWPLTWCLYMEITCSDLTIHNRGGWDIGANLSWPLCDCGPSFFPWGKKRTRFYDFNIWNHTFIYMLPTLSAGNLPEPSSALMANLCLPVCIIIARLFFFLYIFCGCTLSMIYKLGGVVVVENECTRSPWTAEFLARIHTRQQIKRNLVV